MLDMDELLGILICRWEESTWYFYGETMKKKYVASCTIEVYTVFRLLLRCLLIAIICQRILVAQRRINKGQIIVLNDRLVPPSIPRMVQNTYKTKLVSNHIHIQPLGSANLPQVSSKSFVPSRM